MRSFIFTLLLFACSGLLGLSSTATAEENYVILCGGPALRKWEDLRVKKDQHDRWWANFVRASTIRMDEIRRVKGNNAKIVWMVYRKGYTQRGIEDGKPYTQWIGEQAAKRKASLVWITDGQDFVRKLNKLPSGSVASFDFFGHSNKHCFLLDYSADIMAASSSYLHEKELYAIRGRVFAKYAHCQSWGCHTGESMSAYWKSATGKKLIGARGKTNYVTVGKGVLPSVSGSWIR